MKTRDDRPSFALSRRLNLPALLRWLLMMSVLAGPGYVYAVDTTEIKCTGLNGSKGTIKLQLPASVSFDPDGDLEPYTSPPAKFDYTCSATDNRPHTACAHRCRSRFRIVADHDFAPLPIMISHRCRS